jgi:hypothetical protein
LVPKFAVQTRPKPSDFSGEKILSTLASLRTLVASCGESWNALNHWFSSKLGFDVPLAKALCKTFLLRMLNDS